MKNKFFVFLMVGAVLLSAVSVSFAQTKRPKTVKTTNELLPLLPESDAAMTMDGKRFFAEALPQILSANQPMLNEILGKFEEIKTKTGIDVKQFEQIAAGVTAKQISPKEYDFDPLVLARGQINANALITTAKIAAAGKYREEKIGDKVVYVFLAKEIIEQNKGQVGNSKITGMIDKILGGLSKELAVTAYDKNTLALGSLARMREMFETKTRIGGEVLELASRKPNAIISFGARVPGGLSQFIKLDNDELGKNLDSIRLLSGSLDVSDGSTTVALSAKTTDVEQAKNLKETLDALRDLGKVFLGGAKGNDKIVYARMVENAKITQSGSEVMLDLQVPQSDINVLIGEKK